MQEFNWRVRESVWERHNFKDVEIKRVKEGSVNSIMGECCGYEHWPKVSLAKEERH